MSAELRRLLIAAILWLGLYFGVAAVLFGLFVVGGATESLGELFGLALALSAVVTGVALVAVLVDRMVFSRDPSDFLTRQSLWVLVFVGTTIVATGLFFPVRAGSPGDAVLFGVSIALPTTLLLFAAINLARYRSMEHGS